jgi:hypothetical protein
VGFEQVKGYLVEDAPIAPEVSESMIGAADFETASADSESCWGHQAPLFIMIMITRPSFFVCDRCHLTGFPTTLLHGGDSGRFQL